MIFKYIRWKEDPSNLSREVMGVLKYMETPIYYISVGVLVKDFTVMYFRNIMMANVILLISLSICHCIISKYS